MSQSNANYSLRCVRGVDQGLHATDCIDVFEIDADGQPAFRVTYDYGLDIGTQVMKVEQLSALSFAELPFIHSGLQLGAKLIEFLDELLHEIDAEFYADCFYDADGNSISHPINKLMYGEA